MSLTAARHNTGKPSLSELHWFKRGLESLAAHVMAGRTKYPDVEIMPGVWVPNWTLGGQDDAQFLDAIDRHLGEIVRGNQYAHDTGTEHLAAIAWNALAMLTNNSTGPVRVEPWEPITE